MSEDLQKTEEDRPTAGGDRPKTQSKKTEAKKSKAQIKKEEELLRIVREAKDAEAKELAIKSEKDRKQAELDAKNREEHRVRKELEFARLQRQKEADASWISQREQALHSLDLKEEAREDWDHYIHLASNVPPQYPYVRQSNAPIGRRKMKYLCTDLPDVTRETELSAFKSLWMEPLPVSNDVLESIELLVDGVTRVENVVQELAKSTCHSYELLRFPKLCWAQDFINDLRAQSHANIDAVTLKLLQRSGENEKGALSRSYGTKECLYGLWIPSRSGSEGAKDIDWKDIGVTINLPTSLRRTRHAIRFVYSSFDHLVGLGIKKAQEAKVVPETLNPWSEETSVSKKEADTLPGLNPSVPFVSVGGVISCQLLAVPLAAKPAKGWYMREFTSLSMALENVHYPSEPTELPFRIAYTLPDYIILGDKSPLFGWWNAEDNTWCLDMITPAGFMKRTLKVLLS
jgi:hypothetical protein